MLIHENKIEILKSLIQNENVELKTIKQTMQKVVPTYKEAPNAPKAETADDIGAKKMKTIINRVRKTNIKNDKELKAEVG